MQLQILRIVRNKTFLVLLTLLVLATMATAAYAVVIGDYDVEFVSRVYDPVNDETTFTYEVTGLGNDPALSHLVIAIALCTPELEVVSADPPDYTLGPDPTTGVDGIKWDIPLQPNETRTYSFTLAGFVPLGTVDVGVKAGDNSDVGQVPGPACPVPDNEPPICVVLGVNLVNDPRTNVSVRVHDPDSGLMSVVPTTSNIGEVTGEEAGTDWPIGTTDPQTVVAYKANNALKASIKLTVTDVAGNVTVCDPILTTAVRENGKPVSDEYTGIPGEEHYVTITNGNPGLKNLDVVVNGTKFKVAGLGNNEETTLDVASAMVEGDNNTIVLIAYGKPGASAVVMISD